MKAEEMSTRAEEAMQQAERTMQLAEDMAMKESKQADELAKQANERTKALHGFRNYCSTLHHTLLESEFKDNCEDGDDEKIGKALDRTLDWLEKAQPEGKVALEGKQKELKGIVNPIFTKLETTLEQRIADDLEAGAWREDDLALRELACALSALQALQKARSSEG
ncbi:unnamed protein product [Prorocentrum cordatum]|uniref:Tubulin-specific chaperone A n=1 Tax=Prorocentrum cordatum TaxID=2364126 RepID=A0ABN9UHV5_9DINO|nr:unnamed protein product [Polarella glacialis]